tara:strand:- start:2132 stop:2692 length:561 start_codon:yes stop_codon:yes gene_type:complete
MNLNLKKYVKHKKKFLNKKFCNQVIKSLSNYNWDTHTFYKGKNYVKESGNKELDVSYGKQKDPNVEIIMKKLWFEIQDYISSLNFPWFKGWQGYSLIRYNKYNLNKKMAEHCDHINTLFDGKGIPILSLLIVLNDDYEGGEFVMFKNVEYKFKAGDLLIFPSNFLYPHRVNPVKKGTRYSVVSWVW